MKKTLLSCFVLYILSASLCYSQWTYSGNFPDDNFSGGAGCQGLAVSPDGKIWVQLFLDTDSIEVSPGVYSPCKALYCFYQDGTSAPFSPIKTITVNAQTDTLWYNARGLAVDHNGNILASYQETMYRINYLTGEGMNKVIPIIDETLTAPATDTAGNIYTSHVMPNLPVSEFDSQFNFLRNGVTSLTDHFGRTLAVSPDGLTLWVPRFTANKIDRYTRPNKQMSFAFSESILIGMSSESTGWQPGTGYLWLSAGSINNPPSGPFIENTWYAYDTSTNSIKDSITWVWNTAGSIDERPRGIAFSPDGQIAYVACFGGNYPAVQKFHYSTVPVEYLITLNSLIVDNYIQLNWATATETNNAGYSIERNNGENIFHGIGYLEGKGTTIEKQFYSFNDKPQKYGQYNYRLKQIDFDGTYKYSNTIEVNYTASKFGLEQNYPNPFNPNTKIRYSIPGQTFVTIKIYDVLGKELETLVNEEKPAGSYELNFNAENLSSGVYLYQFISNKFIETKKLILLK